MKEFTKMQNQEKQEVNRKRPVMIRFRVTEEERDLIYRKMSELRTDNLAAYMRKMAIDGHIVKVDYSDLKAVCAAMQKIGTNINQIAKRVNVTNEVYSSDLRVIDESVKEIWQLLRLSLSRVG